MVTIGGGGADTIAGGAGDDTIQVTSSGTYDGGDGSDRLVNNGGMYDNSSLNSDGGDDTLFALREGQVTFSESRGRRFASIVPAG